MLFGEYPYSTGDPPHRLEVPLRVQWSLLFFVVEMGSLGFF